MKITIVGIGYVGLSNAILLAQKHEVIAVDITEERVNMINNHKSPIVDETVEEYLTTKKLNLSATTDLIFACQNADYVIVATPTNYNETTNYFDTSSVESVINIVLKHNPSATIIIKSTIPVGFTANLNKNLGVNNIIFSPEFLREGKALYDNLYPSRIIVGTDLSNMHLVEKSKQFIKMLQECAIKQDITTLLINSTEAEAIKLFSNTYLALRIAYFNELDTYAESKNLDSKAIIKGVCLDPRIGDNYNNPSFGYGGYCLPKDTKQLLANYKDIPETLIKAIVESNKVRKEFIANQIINKIAPDKTKEYTIGIYRLTMKTGSDNFRQSAIQDIIKLLGTANLNIIIYEPTAKENTFLGHTVLSNLNEFKMQSDIIVANRVNAELNDVSSKVYTRDVFERD